jgi:hypothetical protein
VNSSLEIAGHDRSSGFVRCHTKAISRGKRKQKNIAAMQFKKGMGARRETHDEPGPAPPHTGHEVSAPSSERQQSYSHKIYVVYTTYACILNLSLQLSVTISVD